MSAYFLTSPDELLLRKQVETLAKKVPVEAVSAHDVNFAEFARDAMGTSLFADQRVVWLQEVAALPTGKKTIGLLADLCAKAPDSTTLVFSQTTHFEGDYRKATSFKSGALYKALVASCDHRDIILKGRALTEWVRSYALSQYQLDLSEPQVNALLESCLQMPSLIDSELRKFALLKRPEAEASIADDTFRTVLARMPGQNVRDMVDAAMARDAKVIGMAIEFYRSQDGGPMLFTELYRGCERLLAILTDPQYASRPNFKNLHSFVQKKLASAALRWRPDELVRNLRLITDAEFRMRTGRAMGRTPAEAERNLVLVLLKQMFGK
jgi:DNA polymerase III delta subunit